MTFEVRKYDRWYAYRSVNKCATCGHNPGMMARISPVGGFNTEQEAEGWLDQHHPEWRKHATTTE